jgi:hypothetical protein
MTAISANSANTTLLWTGASPITASKVGLVFAAAKVKNYAGLFNDTQDLDFLRVPLLCFRRAYLPPPICSDSTIAHLGADIYGNISLRRHLGDLSYTVYAGHRSDSLYSGYSYLLSQFGTFTSLD